MPAHQNAALAQAQNCAGCGYRTKQAKSTKLPAAKKRFCTSHGFISSGWWHELLGSSSYGQWHVRGSIISKRSSPAVQALPLQWCWTALALVPIPDCCFEQ